MLNKQIKNRLGFLLLLPLFILLSGCEFKDIDKDVFVAMIAIDQSDEADKPYKITLKLYEPSSSFKDAPQPTYSYLTQAGETLSEAIRLMEAYSDKELQFGHTKLIVIGEDLVQADKSKEILDFLLRRPDIQMIAWIAVGRPSAEKIIKMVPQGETSAYPELFNYFDHTGTESQYIVTTYLFNFRRDMKAWGIDPVLPIIRINEKDSHFEIDKSLIVRDSMEPHEFDPLNTSLYTMLTKGTDRADLAINEDDEYFIARIDRLKTKHSVTIKGGNKIELDIKIKLYGYISESKKNLDSKDLPFYNKLLKAESEEKFTKFFTDMKELGFDPLGFGVDYRSRTLHNRRMSKEEWEEAYRNAKINLSVTPQLKSTGSIQ